MGASKYKIQNTKYSMINTCDKLRINNRDYMMFKKRIHKAYYAVGGDMWELFIQRANYIDEGLVDAEDIIMPLKFGDIGKSEIDFIYNGNTVIKSQMHDLAA